MIKKLALFLVFLSVIFILSSPALSDDTCKPYQAIVSENSAFFTFPVDNQRSYNMCAKGFQHTWNVSLKKNNKDYEFGYYFFPYFDGTLCNDNVNLKKLLESGQFSVFMKNINDSRVVPGILLNYSISSDGKILKIILPYKQSVDFLFGDKPRHVTFNSQILDEKTSHEAAVTYDYGRTDKADKKVETVHGKTEEPAEDLINIKPPLPSDYMNNSGLEFCEENTNLKSPPNIHNGIDISVPNGKPVFSLCDGVVVFDHTDDDYLKNKYSDYITYPNCHFDLDKCIYWNSFLIIKHNCGNQEFFAYYGHVESILDSHKVKAGQKIAVIRKDPTSSIGDHLHLSIGFTKTWNQSGWGYSNSCREAINKGYKDPLLVLNISRTSSDLRPVTHKDLASDDILWRKKNKNLYLSAEGDYDGDGKTDSARFMMNKKNEAAIVAYLSSYKSSSPVIIGGFWDLESLKRQGIQTAEKGNYKTVCGKGYGCDGGEPPVLYLKYDAIDYFVDGVANSFFVWDKKTEKFNGYQMSD